jgi:hypothetical protein
MEITYHFYSSRVHGFPVGKNSSIALCGKKISSFSLNSRLGTEFLPVEDSRKAKAC